MQPTAGAYEAEVRRAEERVLVDRVMWLAQSAPNAQVRAIASLKLQRLSRALRRAVGHAEADIAHRSLIAADIKRFLERPAENARLVTTPFAPPGAPIGGDVPQNWLQSPTWCGWAEEQQQ